jgi:hypothetical protein
MRLPSKVTSYNESILARFPVLLRHTQTEDIAVMDLLKLVQTQFNEASEYLEALDCLFALGKIELSEEEGVLHYVG